MKTSFIAHDNSKSYSSHESDALAEVTNDKRK